jgi:hypothetical protein
MIPYPGREKSMTLAIRLVTLCVRQNEMKKATIIEAVPWSPTILCLYLPLALLVLAYSLSSGTGGWSDGPPDLLQFLPLTTKHDIWRVNQVRNANVVMGCEETGFFDESEDKDLRHRGADGIKRAIRARLDRTSVTAILIGTHTAWRDWVWWEIEESIARA